jgi:hypothetical protein
MSLYSRHETQDYNRNLPAHYNDYKTNKPTSEVKCQQRMFQKLLELKKQSLLRKCFILESNEFEVLEFYGDAFLYERITKNILRSRRFMDPNLMTTLRRYCIKNDNLATVFDQLGLMALLEPNQESLVLTRKNKADIVEAIIGEIAEHRPDEDVLSEFVAFISYVGEKEYFKENHHVSEPFAAKNSYRKNRNEYRRDRYNDYHGNNDNGYHSNNNNAPSNTGNQTASSTSATSSPHKEVPVFFLQNGNHSQKSSGDRHSSSAQNLFTEPIKILKRGSDVSMMKGTPPNPNTTTESSSGSSGSPRTNSSEKTTKPTIQTDNVFFRLSPTNSPSLSPSFVPSIAATRDGMLLKEKSSY